MGQDHVTPTPELLVKILKRDHRELIELYEEIRLAVTEKRFSAITSTAAKLHDKLQSHIHTETAKLYAGLLSILENPEKREMVLYRHGEILSIGRGAVDLVARAITDPITAENVASFENDLAQVFIDLMACIQAEENLLFPLFISPPPKRTGVT